MNRPHLRPNNRGPEQTRRRFLFALGAGAFWAQTQRTKAWAAGSAGSAATPAPPKRFVGVFTPHGCAYELWKPGPAFDLTYPDCSLAPFDDAARYGSSFKQSLLVVDGLDVAAGMESGTVGHDAARALLTGSGADGKNASLDQYLAVEHLLGQETPHTSLCLGVGSESTDIGANLSYSRGGDPVPKWIDPIGLFDELFGGPLTAEGGAALQAKRLRRQSILDSVRTDLASLKSRVPASELAKMDQHATGLREIEKRLSPPLRACQALARPTSEQVPRLKSFGGAEPFFETITELQIDLLARALCCDLTRFATLMLADLSRSKLYPGYPDDVHQAVAHRYQARSVKGKGVPESWRALAVQNRHSYGHVARLLQRLREGGALDSTLVLVQSDMGDPAKHSSRNVPTILAGGAAPEFRMGRVIDMRSGKGSTFVPHNRLLVSLCQAFGVDTQRFGHSQNSSTVTGTLDGLVTA